ncbi:MAG: 3-hydroxyacyl-CoA dehydrogenase [Hyphomicrobiales bacterium]|nr:MAG: 3-hydroxyacyl-CoA dehydrogenase [Hyphomicrobiales bacterium]
MPIDLSGRVAIVTGAGGGLGREHALLLAKRGAKVLVNDLGGSLDGHGASSTSAERVAEEIRTAGGEAISNGASVTEFDQVQAMVAQATDTWGSVDIIVANAGILRDKTFAKMDLEDFRAVLDVHLMGAVHCIKAAWQGMCDRGYGRIVLTTSATGLYGNFGQSNYGTAKMALVGLMQTLALEGARYNIKVNCLAPSAATRMVEGILSSEQMDALNPRAVSPAVLALVSNEAPTRKIICAGGGAFEQAHITLTQGVYVGNGEDAAEQLASQWEQLADQEGQLVPEQGFEVSELELQKAGVKANEAAS